MDCPRFWRIEEGMHFSFLYNYLNRIKFSHKCHPWACHKCTFQPQYSSIWRGLFNFGLSPPDCLIKPRHGHCSRKITKLKLPWTLLAEFVPLCSHGKCPIFAKMMWVIGWTAKSFTDPGSLKFIPTNKNDFLIMAITQNCSPKLVCSIHGWPQTFHVYISPRFKGKAVGRSKMKPTITLSMKLKAEALFFFLLDISHFVFSWFMTVACQSTYNNNILLGSPHAAKSRCWFSWLT